jgi:hypothetical protein
LQEWISQSNIASKTKHAMLYAMRSPFRGNHINNIMSYKRQELLTPREHICYSPIFRWVRVVICFSSSCVLCAQCCQCHWIVHFWLPLRFSLTFMYWECIRHIKKRRYYVNNLLLTTSRNIIGLKWTRGNETVYIQYKGSINSILNLLTAYISY